MQPEIAGPIRGQNQDTNKGDAISTLASDVAQFGESLIKSAVENPVNAVLQLVSLGQLPEINLVEPDKEATGSEKFAQQAGAAAGSITDFLLLARAADAGLAPWIDDPRSRTLPVTALSGFVNGAVVTPLAPGQTQRSRLTNGLSQAAALSTFSFLSQSGGNPVREASLFKSLFASARRNAVAGLAAGTVESELSSLLSGDGWAPPRRVGSEAAAWAGGAAILGVGGTLLSRGLSLPLSRELLSRLSESRLWRGGPAVKLEAGGTGHEPVLDNQSLVKTASGDSAVVTSSYRPDGSTQVESVRFSDGTVITRDSALSSSKGIPEETPARLRYRWYASGPLQTEPVSFIGDVRVTAGGRLAFDYPYAKAFSQAAVVARLSTGETLAVKDAAGHLVLPAAAVDALSETTGAAALKSLRPLGIEPAQDRLQLTDASVKGDTVSTVYGITLTEPESLAIKRAIDNGASNFALAGRQQRVLPPDAFTATTNVPDPESTATDTSRFYSYPVPMPDHTSTVSFLFKDNAGNLKVLTGTRNADPFKGAQSLPGGFMEISGGQLENPSLTAAREMQEETGLSISAPHLVRVGDSLGRDPRNRVIDFQYLATGTEADLEKLFAGDDLGHLSVHDVNDLLASPGALAFDHEQALAEAVKQYKNKV